VTVLALVAGAHAVAATFPLNLEDPLSGQPVRIEPGPAALHLVFFATWCPPCLEELDRLAELEARHAHQGYRLVLIAVPTRQSRERLAQLIQRRRPPGTVVFDASGAARDALVVGEIPAHVLVDASGKVVEQADGLSAELEQAIARILRDGR
jgi:thiol-disulfide isomerase/thioredoxin